MIDDIQYIAEKTNAQEELLCIFNALYKLKKQIIVTSCSTPDKVTNLDAGFRSFFNLGLMTEIRIPSLETMPLILAKKAEAAGVSLDDDVSRFLISLPSTNVRELEGRLTKLIAHASLEGKTINLDLAKRVLTN